MGVEKMAPSSGASSCSSRLPKNEKAGSLDWLPALCLLGWPRRQAYNLALLVGCVRLGMLPIPYPLPDRLSYIGWGLASFEELQSP